ncbi:MAG: hypothetical protein WCJ75_17225 [Desulfomonile sp.]
MYQCKVSEITVRRSNRVIEHARKFIEEWRSECSGSRPHARVKFLGKKQRVFIDDFHYHIEAKSMKDMTGRYRLLPCVKELLKHSTDEPSQTEDGNLMLQGRTPTGDKFIVIIRPEKRGGYLQSFYKTRT